MSSDMVGSWQRFVAAFNRNSVDDVADVIAPTFVDHHVPPELPAGVEGVRRWWGVVHDAFDCRLDVEDVVEGVDRIATRMTFSGVHTGDFQGLPATGKPFSAAFMSIERFEDGRLVERWEVGDMVTILGQLGVLATG